MMDLHGGERDGCVQATGQGGCEDYKKQPQAKSQGDPISQRVRSSSRESGDFHGYPPSPSAFAASGCVPATPPDYALSEQLACCLMATSLPA